MALSSDPSITIKRGDTWIQQFNWIQKSNNLPVDLSGCMAKMDLISGKYGRVLEITTESSPSHMTIDGPNGEVQLRVEAEDTSNLIPGTYKTDLQVTFSDGTVKSTSTFFIIVEEDITR